MDFNKENLKRALAEQGFGNPLYFRNKTSSTNNLAYRLAEVGAPEGTAVFADCQTAGKGRRNRSWVSPAGVNLYVSLILRPTLAPALCAVLPLLAGVAVADLATVCGVGQVHLKWPNDVYLGPKKIAGILTEMKSLGKEVQFIILGIGINVNMAREQFPAPLADTATSLREEKGAALDRVEVVATLFKNMEIYYELLLREGFGPIRQLWLRYSRMVDQYCEVRCGGELSRGRMAGIDEGGALLLLTEDGGLHRVLAGDATIIKQESGVRSQNNQ